MYEARAALFRISSVPTSVFYSFGVAHEENNFATKNIRLDIDSLLYSLPSNLNSDSYIISA